MFWKSWLLFILKRLNSSNLIIKICSTWRTCGVDKMRSALKLCNQFTLALVRLWNLFDGGSRFFAKDQQTQKKLLYSFSKFNENRSSKSAKIWLSKWIFYVKHHLKFQKLILFIFNLKKNFFMKSSNFWQIVTFCIHKMR